MVGPAFFDQGHEQRTGFFQRAKSPGLACGRVSVALHGGGSGDDEHVAALRGGARGKRSRLDHAEHRHGNGVLNCIECKRAGRVAGDDEVFGALLIDEELRAFRGVVGDGAARLGAVGQAGRVAEEGVARVGNVAEERAQDSEPAEAGVKDADAGGFHGRTDSAGMPLSAGAMSEVRYVRVRSAWSTRKRTRVTRGRFALCVPQMESTVRVSVSRPDGWPATKLPLRLITAIGGPESVARGAPAGLDAPDAL